MGGLEIGGNGRKIPPAAAIDRAVVKWNESRVMALVILPFRKIDLKFVHPDVVRTV